MNIEKARERGRKWYWKNPDHVRALKRRAAKARLQAMSVEELDAYKKERADIHRKWREKNRLSLRESKRAYYLRNQEGIVKKQRERYARRNYAMTLDQIASMLESQNGGCAICAVKTPGGNSINWHIDHDHATGRVRGLLCNNCNLALGLMKDNPKQLREAARYLEKQRN